MTKRFAACIFLAASALSASGAFSATLTASHSATLTFTSADAPPQCDVTAIPNILATMIDQSEARLKDNAAKLAAKNKELSDKEAEYKKLLDSRLPTGLPRDEYDKLLKEKDAKLLELTKAIEKLKKEKNALEKVRSDEITSLKKLYANSYNEVSNALKGKNCTEKEIKAIQALYDARLKAVLAVYDPPRK
jgi:septal ring factor EnvC (AmiA/AmiB activator)